jgi:hypothetical protein
MADAQAAAYPTPRVSAGVSTRSCGAFHRRMMAPWNGRTHSTSTSISSV